MSRCGTLVSLGGKPHYLVHAERNRRVPCIYRTQVGVEIDQVPENDGKPEMVMKVMRSMVPSSEKGFAIACDGLQVTQRYVVHLGHEHIPLRHGAQAIGL